MVIVVVVAPACYRSLFLTGGQDGAVRLYHMLEQSPLRSWEPSPPAEDNIDSDGVSWHFVFVSPCLCQGDMCACCQFCDTADMDTPFAAISCVCFSPTRPTVFAAASRDGYIYIFDLFVNQSGPIRSVRVPPVGATMQSMAEAEANGRPVTGAVARATSLSFNGKQRDLIAACDQTGRVFVWKMGWSLSNRKRAEQSVLDRLGSVTGDEDMPGLGLE